MIPDLKDAILLGIPSLLIFYLAWKRGVFAIREAIPSAPLRWFDPLAVFALYFLITILSSRYLPSLVNALPFNLSPLAFSCFLTLLISLSILLAVFLYSLSIPKEIRRRIWKRLETASLLETPKTSLLFALLAFPLTLFLGKVFEIFIYAVFHVQEIPDQLAVLFVKMTFGHVPCFLLAMITIVVLAPLLEEWIFRGFFQSYLRRHLGIHGSILLTSCCFALFHYAPEQKLANIPILASLLLLSYFLGLIYEKKGSLLAPICLHAFFNAISIAGLYFLGDPA